jgi:hypothetical protein
MKVIIPLPEKRTAVTGQTPGKTATNPLQLVAGRFQPAHVAGAKELVQQQANPLQLMEKDKALPVQGKFTTPGPQAVAVPVVQRVKWGKLTLGVLGTLFTAGLIWCSEGFREYMSDTFSNDREGYEEVHGEDEDAGNYRKKLEQNDFRTGAGLEQYAKAFGPGFIKDIENLAENERWMDGGAGVGQAMSDYYGRGGRGLTTAVAYKRPGGPVKDDQLTGNEKFNYVEGKFFGQMDDDRDLGVDGADKRMSVITDYNGILSYTETLSEDLQKYVNNLKVGGKIYTFFYASIDGRSDREQMYNWLRSCKGIELTVNKESIVVTKTAEEAWIRPLVFVSHGKGDSSNIPTREYTMK